MAKQKVSFSPKIFEWQFNKDDEPSKKDKNAARPCLFGNNCKNKKICHCVHPSDNLSTYLSIKKTLQKLTLESLKETVPVNEDLSPLFRNPLLGYLF
jgi:L-asparaginase II